MPREHAVLANDAGSVYMIVVGKVSVQSSMLVGVHNCSNIKYLHVGLSVRSIVGRTLAWGRGMRM